MITLVSPLDVNKTIESFEIESGMTRTTNGSGDVAEKKTMDLMNNSNKDFCQPRITCITSQVATTNAYSLSSNIAERNCQTIHGVDGLNNLALIIFGVSS